MTKSNALRAPEGAESKLDAEARRGLVGLRFPSPLEGEFRLASLMRDRNRVRFWHCFLLAVGLLYGTSRLEYGAMGDPASSFEILLRFLLLFPARAVLAWLAWSPRYERFYPPVARLLVPLAGCLVALLVTVRLSEGYGQALSSIATQMLGVLFLSGLLFRQAIVVCAFMTATFLVTALQLDMSPATLFFAALPPLITVGVGAFVLYEVEKASRTAFLDQRRVAREAASDGLTGLKNRRAFDEHLRRVWQHCSREQRPLGLLFMDADFFKSYNDRYGHQAGDRCLKQIAELAQRAALRPLDMAARFGGEELAIILHDMSSEQVVQTAERLRKAVEALGIEHRGSVAARVVTVSIGAACVSPSADRSCEGVVQLADEALYEGKSQGRNCVILKEDEYQHLATGIFRGPLASPDQG